MTEPLTIVINIPANADRSFMIIIKRVAGLFQALLRKWEMGEDV
jgi:hypothetical protein